MLIPTVWEQEYPGEVATIDDFSIFEEFESLDHRSSYAGASTTFYRV